MDSRKWWQAPMRVMQYNLQVKDTPGMDAERIARETEELGCNAVVMNVGGIYAWYPSKIRYHHINEYLPEGRDLLEELTQAFHRRGIRFIARFDFSIAEDTVYLEHPEWFARGADRQPFFQGEKRMGSWSLFLTTCAYGGYRNGEVAVPVLREALSRYDIDGVFLNAPQAAVCFCEKCRAKYEERYGAAMPESAPEFAQDWLSMATKDNIANLNRAIKETDPEIPLILYYQPFAHFSGGHSPKRFDRDSIYDRYATADLICTESQDILSRGVNAIPGTSHTVLAMKAGQRDDEALRPFGIIHSCPGMDWRHIGLPEAEYLPWMAQVPAGGAVLWHSVTGYPDSILDKRVLKACGRINHMIEKTEKSMDGAKSCSDVLLAWNSDPASISMGDGLVKNQITFDLLQDYSVDIERMRRFRAVVVPDGLLGHTGLAEALAQYVREGGNALIECSDPRAAAANRELLGVREEDVRGSEYLAAAYYRIEEADALGKGFEDTDKLAFRGHMVYVKPEEGTKVPATLVPPFAPPEAVGRPPERASIPVPHTEIPLTLVHTYGAGKVVFLPFALSALLREYRLADHFALLHNLVELVLPERRVSVDAPSTVHVTAFSREDRILVHLVNETGERPLRETIPVGGITVRIRVPEGRRVRSVREAIRGQEADWTEDGGVLAVRIARLDVWEMIDAELYGKPGSTGYVQKGAE